MNLDLLFNEIYEILQREIIKCVDEYEERVMEKMGVNAGVEEVERVFDDICRVLLDSLDQCMDIFEMYFYRNLCNTQVLMPDTMNEDKLTMNEDKLNKDTLNEDTLNEELRHIHEKQKRKISLYYYQNILSKDLEAVNFELHDLSNVLRLSKMLAGLDNPNVLKEIDALESNVSSLLSKFNSLTPPSEPPSSLINRFNSHSSNLFFEDTNILDFL